MTDAKVLVAISVYNEEANIEKWLTHWTALCEDIVIFDQSSSDNTRERINAFISTHPKLKDSIMVFTVPTLGMCEPLYMAAQKFDNGEKWLVKMDADEFMGREEFRMAIEECERQRKTNNISTMLVARRNMIDGRDASPLFGAPHDPEGRDWHPRFIYGLNVGFGFNMHHYPQINGRFAYLDPEKIFIKHERTYEDIVKSNLARMKYANEQAKQMQMQFIQKAAQFLGLNKEQFEQIIAKYDV